ncbi:non-homologous end-joining DNA ligase LigD [Devosia sp. A449]
MNSSNVLRLAGSRLGLGENVLPHFAELLARTEPDRFVGNMSKVRRKDHVFLDYLRNGQGSTTICPWSTRAGGTPATPLLSIRPLAAEWIIKMGASQYDPAAAGRPAWNVGKQVGAKRPLKVRQIWAIRFFLDREQRMQDRACLTS